MSRDLLLTVTIGSEIGIRRLVSLETNPVANADHANQLATAIEHRQSLVKNYSVWADEFTALAKQHEAIVAKSEARTSNRLFLLGIGIVGILLVLTSAFRCLKDALVIMLNLPLALMVVPAAYFRFRQKAQSAH